MAFLTDETYEKVSADAMKLARETPVLPPTRPSVSAPAYKPPDALSDGLGHWWDSTTGSWQNDSGGAYQSPEPQYTVPDPTPVTQQDFIAADRAMDTTSQFRPDWGVMNTPEVQQGGGFFGGLKSAAGAVQDFGGDFVDVLQKNRPGASVVNMGSLPTGTQQQDMVPGTPPLYNPNKTGMFWGDNVPFLKGVGEKPELSPWLRGTFADPSVENPDESFGTQIKGGLKTAGSALNTLASGNKFVREVTKGEVDPSTLPYNLDKLTDIALSPVTWATAGAGQGFRGAGLLGSVTKGPFAKRLAGEVAVGTGGLIGSEKAAEKAAEYTDNPYLVGGAGLLGGLGAGLGAVGALNAATRAPEIGLTPRAVLKGEYGGSGAIKGQDPNFPPRISPPNEDPEFAAGVRKILDATTKEANIRRVGTAEREIKGGRAQQFGGILGALNEGQATPEETLLSARGAAAVGKLRKTTAAPIDLTPAEKNAVLSDIIARVQNDDLPPWAIFNATGADSALEKLLRGDGLQPAEIKWVRQTFGDEVADSVKSRPITADQILREDAAEQIKSREYNARMVAKQEKAAADDLARQNREIAARQETADRAVQRERWKTIAKANSVEELQQRLGDPFITAEERAIATKAITAEAGRAQNVAGKAVDDIWARAKKANPDAEDLRRRADALIDKKVTDPRTNEQVKKTIALWADGNRIILDGIGENRVQEIAGGIGRMISGDVADSHLAALVHRRAYLQTAIEMGGVDPVVAKKAANVLLERELKIRYPNGVPDNIQEMLNSTKALPYGEQGAIAGIASVSQKMKNTQFGVGDIAIFGQQVLKAITTGGVNLTAGLVNDTLSLLHLPHIRTLYADSNLPKMVQYQLDGVAQGASTGITDLSREGTLIGGLGRVGRAADKHAVVPFTRALTDFQFKTVLGALRNLNHEGNLVIAKLAGQDIQNPSVRATAAAFANANTSYWAPAQKSARAQAEKALLLSAPMRRAQIAQIRLVTKLLDGTGPERILAATTLASAGISLLAIGKLVNDYIGVGDFEFDPSKPGFGKVTVPNPFGGPNLVLGLFPQEQVLTAFTKAVRVLAENPDKAGGIDAAKEIGKLLLSSSSPAARIGEAAAGFGFDPQESRYKFGDLNDGKSWVDRVMNMAPIPPVVTDLINKGFDPARTPLGMAGVNVYDESDYQPRDRKAQEMFNTDYADLPPTAATNGVYDPTKPSQRAVDEANGGKLESTYPNTIARNKVIAANRTENVGTQQAIDAKYIRPGATAPDNYDDGKAWRAEKRVLDYAIREQWKTLEKAMPYTGPESKNPMRLAMNAWGAEMDAARNGTETDYDRVDKWMAEHPAEAKLVNEYMAGKVNTDLTEVVTAKNAAAKTLGDKGFFDLRDNLWAELNAQSPAPGYVAGQGYYEWRDALIEETTREMIASGVSPTIAATKAETAVDTKHPVVKKFNDVYKPKVLYPWVDANPEAATTAVQWGYLYPDTKLQKFIQSREAK